ncbi:recombinase RecA [Candidatus Marinamargulisbacteria bacterium SCGC AG-343-D04]|nr:recombinase RecA [Candidatus Marinamargulisbacteria bacterium SCGC AG-343-D04]
MENTLTEIEKIQTGIEGFDKLTYGGLPRGRAYLVSGEPGTGKTIFTLQYLLEGLKNGEKATYISIDEKPTHIIADAHALGWDLTPYLEKGQLQIIDITEYFGSTQDKAGNKLNITNIVTNIKNFIHNHGSQRVAIDPIAPLIFSDSEVSSVIQYIRSLIFTVESIKDCTTLLTSYIPVGSDKVSCFGIEEFAASGIIVLKLITQNNKRIRSIGVRKMRSTRIDLSEYSYEILPNRGLTLRQPL